MSVYVGVAVYVSILTHCNEPVSCTSSFKLSGNFSHGTSILSSTRSSTEVVFYLCRKFLLSQVATSTGEKRTHFKDKLEKHWQNRQQTVSMGTEMLISSVLFILFMSFPQKGNNYSFCHCLPFFLVFYAVLYECSGVSHGCWRFEKRKRSWQHFVRLQDFAVFLLTGPLLPFITSPPFNLPFTFLHQILTKWEPCGLLLCAGGKGALD